MRLAVLFTAAILAAIPSHAAPFLIGAVEDLPGTTGEKNGDYNDFIFSIMGDVFINAPGGAYTHLTPNLLSENGPIFWDNPSYGHKNVGFCLLGDAACAIPGIDTVNYLAGEGGAQLLNQTFHASGDLTFAIMGQFSAYASISSLGWCEVTDCKNTQHVLFAPGGTNSITVTPSADFALYFTNGVGQFYGSRAIDNQNESGTQQHFAFFSDPPASVVPEPASLGLFGLGLGGLGLSKLRRRSR